MAEPVVFHEGGPVTRGRFGYRAMGTLYVDGITVRLAPQGADVIRLTMLGGDRPVPYKLILEHLGSETDALANSYVRLVLAKVRATFRGFLMPVPVPVRAVYGYGLRWVD